MVLVIAPITAPLHRAQLGKFLLPIAQHMGLDAAQLGDFTNGEIAFRRNQWERHIHGGALEVESKKAQQRSL